MRIASGIAVFAVLTAACDLRRSPRESIFGFTPASSQAQRSLERRLLPLPDSQRIRDTHRELTRKPHPAGSARDRELAEWTARQFADAGMQDVQIVTHEVMLPRPVEVTVEMTAPHAWRAAMREQPVDDPDTHIDVAAEAMPFHAYSASGEITAPVVFAGDGSEAAYGHLAREGIDVSGRIVLVTHADLPRYVYRGYKAWIAQQKGAAAILMFADPSKAANDRGAVYPAGPWGPASLIERGGIIYDFLVPGDPLTPGWASVPGARRIDRKDAVSLPRIVSAPLSAQDARPILEALGGPAAPIGWTTQVAAHHRLGPGPATARVKVRTDDTVRPVWTVTGTFRGSESPDEVVILGNHRDAWVYGGVDPSSGSAALIELARCLGALARQGWRPRRSIMFASWDAEEFALTSSTEWVEQHEAWLQDRAVAYLNVDGAVSGTRLAVAAVPSLSRLIAGAGDAVRDPATGLTLATLLRDRRAALGASTPNDPGVVDERLGGGSDYIPFLTFAGVPVADLSFEEPYPVYHSLYDTHQWVSRFGDPGFRYHATLVQLWGIVALRLAHADVVPLDPELAAIRIAEYVDDEISKRPGPETTPVFHAVKNAAARLKTAAAAFSLRRETALARDDRAAMSRLTREAIQFERAFIGGGGLEGREWYRHAIYAPHASYEPIVLPGLQAALEGRDRRRLDRELARLTTVLERAIGVLGSR